MIVGTTTPSNILQVGGAGRLRIANGISDYTIIGTKDIDDNATNTKIFINGNTFTGANNAGSIQYFATKATGAHVFYGGSPVGEKLRIDGGGSISCTGNINMGTNHSYPDIRLGTANGNNTR